MSATENSDQLWEVDHAPEAAGMPMAEWWRRLAGYPKAVLRYLAPTLLFLIPILGFALWVADGLSPLWDGRRRAVHDKLAGSMVVNAAR
jgi:hypothetical protein